MIDPDEWRQKFFKSNDAKLALARAHKITLQNLSDMEYYFADLVEKYENDTGKKYEEPDLDELKEAERKYNEEQSE